MFDEYIALLRILPPASKEKQIWVSNTIDLLTLSKCLDLLRKLARKYYKQAEDKLHYMVVQRFQFSA